MYISFGQAITNPKCVVVLEGSNAEKFIAKDKKNQFRTDKIRRKIPMKFMKINTIIHRELSDVEYIEFWNEIKIKLI